jgi:hypothetical protein
VQAWYLFWATILRPKAKSSGPKLIMHIGGSKCGSSSLQTFLTRNPHLETLEGSQVYCWKVIEQKTILRRFNQSKK